MIHCPARNLHHTIMFKDMYKRFSCVAESNARFLYLDPHDIEAIDIMISRQLILLEVFQKN